VAFRDKEAVLIKRITKVDKGKYFLEGIIKKIVWIVGN